jgi:predicted DNA-binding transcriptional regulator AlpA
MKSNETPTHDAKSPRILLRPPARAKVGGISEATEIRLEQTDPDWPKRVFISPGLSGYLEHELDEFIAKKVALRDGGVVPAIAQRAAALGRSGRGGRPPGSRNRWPPRSP